MPKYLLRASYTKQGTMGLLEEGGSGRREAVEKLVAELGGEVEAFYFAYGEDDAIVLIDFPDHPSMATFAMTVTASGAVNVKTTVLLTPEEIDEATRSSVDYRPPGT